KYYHRINHGSLLLGYQRETFVRETTISSSAPGRFDENGMTFDLHIASHAQWSTELTVATSLTEEINRQKVRNRKEKTRDLGENLKSWMAGTPKMISDMASLMVTYERSLVDLAALRFSPRIAGGRSLPAAGLPWFMAMFGRDSILTSLQALPFVPELAETTLRALATWQGNVLDDFRDEDPGRILHGIRYGETAAFEEQPHSPYYGNADATPLFVVLMDEYERWTGDSKLVKELEPEARAALAWIDDYADLQGNGYVSYKRRNETTGLENQCWKDSWDSISYRDGRLPDFPRATCELQGYA